MSKPARLGKVENQDYATILIERIEAWAIAHATLLFVIAFAVLIALFVVLIFALTGVSATESGTVYNGFDKII